MSEADVTESDRKQRVEFAFNDGNRGEEFACFGNGHIEHLMDAAALVANIECFAVIAFALTIVTGHIDIWQKVHFHLDQPVTLAGLAASTAHIEGKSSDLVPAGARFGCTCKEFPYRGKESGIGGGVGSGSAADRALVNINDLVKLLQTLNPVMRRRLLPARMQMPGHGRV